MPLPWIIGGVAVALGAAVVAALNDDSDNSDDDSEERARREAQRERARKELAAKRQSVAEDFLARGESQGEDLTKLMAKLIRVKTMNSPSFAARLDKATLGPSWVNGFAGLAGSNKSAAYTNNKPRVASYFSEKYSMLFDSKTVNALNFMEDHYFVSLSPTKELNKTYEAFVETNDALKVLNKKRKELLNLKQTLGLE